MLQTRESTQKVATNTEVLVHCQRCHDFYTIEATLHDRRILRYDSNPHIIKEDVRKHNGTVCHCGGKLLFFHG